MTKRVAEQGMPALALTDHGSMYGVIPFYAAAKQAGIKPIIGIEAYVAPRGMTDKEGKTDADYHHMILLAKDDVGYRNLLALTTAAHLDGYYYKPRIDKELLAKHRAGLIGTSACLGGEVLKRLGAGRRAGSGGGRRRAIGPSWATGTSSSRSRSTGSTTSARLHPQLVELARRQNIPLRRDERHALHPPRAVRGARPPGLHPDRVEPRHAGADALREQRVLPEARRRDAPPLQRRAARGVRQHAAHRRAVRRHPRLRAACACRTSRCPMARPRAPGCARSASADCWSVTRR